MNKAVIIEEKNFAKLAVAVKRIEANISFIKNYPNDEGLFNTSVPAIERDIQIIKSIISEGE